MSDKMRISKSTMGVLQNFCTINPSILIEAGSVLRSINSEKTVIAKADVEEKFPVEFAIYDLPNFLQVIKMFDQHEIEFTPDNYCMIRYTGSNTVVRYMYAAPEAVETVKKDINMPTTEVNFKILASQLASIVKAATTMSLNHLIISPCKNGVNLTVTDVDNPNSNNFQIEVEADLSMNEFAVVFSMSKILNLLPGDYDIGISSKKISHWMANTVQYWVALDSASKIN